MLLFFRAFFFFSNKELMRSYLEVRLYCICDKEHLFSNIFCKQRLIFLNNFDRRQHVASLKKQIGYGLSSFMHMVIKPSMIVVLKHHIFE